MTSQETPEKRWRRALRVITASGMKPVFLATASVQRGALVLDGVNVADLSAMLRAHGERVRVTLEFVNESPSLPVRAMCDFCKRSHYPQDPCQE